MKELSKNLSPAPRSKWLLAFILLVILAILFWRSFLPGFVHFSNDGPLGMQNAAWMHLPEAITGSWYDLNSIGSSAGAASPSIVSAIRWVLGPVGFSKFLAPISLWILGLGAWFFFRQLKLSPLAAVLGGLATALNSTFFSDACWGEASHEIAIAMDFFAMGLVVANSPTTPALTRWSRLALAGLCVGMNVMEAADIGAILSVFVAAFVFFKALNEEGRSIGKKIGSGIGRVAVVAIFAGFLAMQTVIALVGASITGIAGTGQDVETKAAHWDWATQWSLPKKETLGLFVPGLFGYKMDTPKDMMPALQDAYKGGAYWGGVGRDPAIDRYFDSGRQGAQPPGFMRFTGGGNYTGILVALLAAFAIAQSLRRKNSPFSKMQKHFIWFWAVIIVLSLLLSWGRFAPLFYRIFYALPYASTIRNPAKFLIIFSWAAVILSAYGAHVLSRRYLEVPVGNTNSISVQLKNWWAKIRGFDRNWTIICGVILGASVLAWLIYAAQKPSLVQYLQSVGFPDEDTAKAIAAFSLGQVGWFILFFALAVGLCIFILAGIFAGKRARLGGILLGILLVADLGRANLPWIIHWNYKQKYASNPIIDLLKDKPYEHRVALLPFRMPDQFQLFEQLYRIEWAQHHFPYYNIQSLDIIQMPRVPADLEAFENALAFRGNPDDAWLIARRWQLTNTRYLLGPAGFLDTMNEQLDPMQHRFHIVQRFNVQPKPGVDLQELQDELKHEEWHGEKFTAVLDDNGPYALFEFTGALPRVKLYSHWQVSTNDDATLKMLAAKNFDPQQTVLVSTPLPTSPATNSTDENDGTVDFKSYSPKKIIFDDQANAPSVLLLNDKHDPHWSVRVDDRPAKLLRCNFIMRGVYLTPGAHTVEFQFMLPNKPLYITLAAIALGIFLIGLLIFLQRRKPAN
ncbi:MAG TPA: hypothetical protein VIK59_02515 [Verrucomicrobiae bacterium]